MNAEIYGEDDVVTGVNIVDNNGVEHDIQVKRAGEVHSHHQDGYPDDPSERSLLDEEAPVKESRRYAKYYVQKERGYDTVEWRLDPDRILAVALTIARMDTDAVDEHFGDLYDQVRSHYGDVERPVSLPDEVRSGHLNYQQDVYLGIEADALTELTRLSTELPDQTGDSIEEVAAGLLEAASAEADVPGVSDLEVTAVSGVHLRWDVPTGYNYERNGQPDIDRDPDARLDIGPFEPADIEEFRSRLVHNLLCQVRDCYIEMGLTPPEQFRIKGMGKQQMATLYDSYDYYPRYHDPDADIDWDVEPDAPTVET